MCKAIGSNCFHGLDLVLVEAPSGCGFHVMDVCTVLWAEQVVYLDDKFEGLHSL